jgi:hypothetical protein
MPNKLVCYITLGWKGLQARSTSALFESSEANEVMWNTFSDVFVVTTWHLEPTYFICWLGGLSDPLVEVFASVALTSAEAVFLVMCNPSMNELW